MINTAIKNKTMPDKETIENTLKSVGYKNIKLDSEKLSIKFLKKGAKVGNFVEVKKSVVGEDSKVNHLSYIGDAEIGKNVNVGAGTITCNYDGMNKFRTVLSDGVFIGSDTQLVAPVKVGKGAFVGAGTTVTKDVKPFSLVISRVPQREIPNWARRKKSKKK